MEFDTVAGIQEKINNAIKDHQADIAYVTGGIVFYDMDVNGDHASREAMEQAFEQPPSDDMFRDSYMYKMEITFTDGSTESVAGNVYLAEAEKEDIMAQIRQPSTLNDWAADAENLGAQQTQFEAVVTSDESINSGFYGMNELYQEIKAELSQQDQASELTADISNPTTVESFNVASNVQEEEPRRNIFDADPNAPAEERTNIFDEAPQQRESIFGSPGM